MEKQQPLQPFDVESNKGPVLVVDDDLHLRQLLQWALEDEGLVVETAADGLEALERVRQRQPALLILDMDLPLLDGAGVADELHALCGAAVPILTITADGHVVEKAHRVGALSYLRKPFDLAELISAVKKALSSQREGSNGVYHG